MPFFFFFSFFVFPSFPRPPNVLPLFPLLIIEQGFEVTPVLVPLVLKTVACINGDLDLTANPGAGVPGKLFDSPHQPRWG